MVILALLVGSLVSDQLPLKEVEMKPYCTVGTEVHCAYQTMQDCQDNRTAEETCQQNPEGK